jgi:hypothetical protein
MVKKDRAATRLPYPIKKFINLLFPAHGPAFCLWFVLACGLQNLFLRCRPRGTHVALGALRQCFRYTMYQRRLVAAPVLFHEDNLTFPVPIASFPEFHLDDYVPGVPDFSLDLRYSIS